MFKMPANERVSERASECELWRKKVANLFIAYDANEMHTTHIKTTMKERKKQKQTKTSKNKWQANESVLFKTNSDKLHIIII